VATGKMFRLTATLVAKVKEPGMYHDGAGLYLRVAPGGTKAWLLRYRHGGRRRDMGLGPLSSVSLATAREKADAARRAVAIGVDPIRAKERERSEAAAAADGTFRATALRLIDGKKDGWKNEKHRGQWLTTLSTYAFPHIGDKMVADIDVADVEACLRPIWMSKPETARRVRQRIGAVLDYAIARRVRTAGNVAKPEILKHILPDHKTRPKHHAALPYGDVYAFLSELKAREAPAARAFEFLILTACRTGEMRGATWREIDLDARVWVVPGDRIKSGVEHRVPLSPRALEILEAAFDAAPKTKGKVDPAGWVFPGASADGRLSENALTELLERMRRTDITAHGFRSTFRDWCAERTSYPRELAEKALAHVVGDEAERAYQRGDLLEKRRAMMDAWATWCATPPAQAVLPFTPRKAGGAK
jgi:integrase